MHRLVDAALQVHRVGAGGHVLRAGRVDGLGQYGGGGGAVAGLVGRFRSHFLHELGAHVLDGVAQLNFLGHGHAVLGDGGRAEFLVDDDVAAFGAEGHFHGVRQFVHAGLQLGAAFGVELNVLSHFWRELRS